jgi:hypothetical protein
MGERMLWIALRILWVAWAALFGPGVARWPYEKAGYTFLAAVLALMVLLGAMMSVSLLSITRLGLRPGNTWQRPSWRTKPSFREPAQIVHLLAWFFIGGGVSATVCAMWIPGSSFQGGVAIAGAGAGFLAGLHAAVHLFRRAFSDHY